eukprot:gene10746-11897_t
MQLVQIIERFSLHPMVLFMMDLVFTQERQLVNGLLEVTAKGSIVIEKGHFIATSYHPQTPHKNQTVTVKFTEFATECSYDFLYIFDGGTYQSPLLGSLTGNDLPGDITSSSHQMLIMLFSDSYKVSTGFKLTYEATDCPRKCSNAGTCSPSGKCSCAANYKGDYCQYPSCPVLCYSSIAKGTCDIAKKKCQCSSGNYGDSCSLSSVPNSDANSWHKLSSQPTIFQARSRHFAAYVKETDTLWVHGGRSFNEIFDDILMYNITSNSWYDFKGLLIKPTARFQHAGGVYQHNLVIYGGQLSSGTNSDELWMFNMNTKAWSQPVGHDTNKPIAVAGHTANIVGSKLYIFGGLKPDCLIVFGLKPDCLIVFGRTTYGAFSADIFMFDLQSSSTGWKKLTTSGGKTSMLRLVGHSSVYNSYTNSLLIFGGELSRSKQNRLLSFSLDHHVFTELVPNQHVPLMLPKPRSFHSAVIAGDYMVIYGGMLSALMSSVCHSNKLLYYNIKCNAWVYETTLVQKSPASSLSKPPSQGRYAHVGVMRGSQTMLVVGGYSGTMHGDVLAYRLPRTVAFVNQSGIIEAGHHCGLYDEKYACYNDPACGWCFDDLKCHSLLNAHNCPLNFDSRHCTSHCTAYPSCSACTLFGNASVQRCSWCVQDSKCYSSLSPGGRCAADKAKLQKGWWGSQSRLLSTDGQCMTDDIPPGIMSIEYTEPMARDFPDGVRMLRTPHIAGTNLDTANKVYELTGFIYPYVLETNPTQAKRREVFISGRQVDMWLSMSPNELNTSKFSKLNFYQIIATGNPTSPRVQVASIAYNADTRYVKARLPNDANLFGVVTKQARYYMQCRVGFRGRRTYEARVSWNLTSSIAAGFEVIHTSYLHPYMSGTCSNYRNCMACMTDAGCGWCSVSSSCIPRSSWPSCVSSNLKTLHLTLNASMCVQCPDYTDCKECTQNSYCSWNPTYWKCSRRGLSATEVHSPAFCPSSCSSRSNCSSCLVDSQCRWCDKNERCFSHSDFMVQYSMGECLKYRIRGDSSNACQNCSRHTTCASCFADHRCGWCGNVDNPLIGLCRDGDFAGPKYGGNCSAIMNTNETAAWSYDRCPDVDECRLKMDKCNSNATCFNTYGSYICICNRGFTGDGRTKCDKTCYHQCYRGHCGADYQCKCDLGWKGINCSIDCGCNGHSTCNNGIGICDECKEHTKGMHCQECLFATFGNATSSAGCKPCQCNGHGDEKRGVCDTRTGKCFCMNHTTGDKCEKCQAGLVGDARNGGVCYHNCSEFNMIKTVLSGALSMGTKSYNCLWVISASNVSNYGIFSVRNRATATGGNVTRSLITLKFSDLKLPCQESHVYIYDGVPLLPAINSTISNSQRLKPLASVCGYDGNSVGMISVTSGSLSIVYKGPKLKSKVVDAMFVARFNVYDCPWRCSGNRVCQPNATHGVACVCKHGWMGVNCDQLKCPNNCTGSAGQGFCDAKTSRCICLPGFTGTNCNETAAHDKFTIRKVAFAETQTTRQPAPRYGHTFLHYQQNNSVILYAGRGLHDSLYNDAWSFSLQHHSYEKIPAKSDHQARYFHCGAIYKDKMFIYGGTTAHGVSNDFLSLSLANFTWTVLKPSRSLPTLFGHSCTLVGNSLFVIGGYGLTENLNEFTLKINLDTLFWEYLKPSGFPIAGVYGHSAVYDGNGNIFVFGGIAFYEEKIQESSRVYRLDIVSMSWNYLRPVAKNEPFKLYYHSASMFNDVMFVTGGYSDVNSRGFNSNLFVWKRNCDTWMRLSLTDRKYTQGDAFSPAGVGSTAIALNDSSILVSTGYTGGKLPGDTWHIELPKDLCSLLRSKVDCLSSSGCSWCNSRLLLPNNGSCFGVNSKIPHPCNYTTGWNRTVNSSSVVFSGTQCNSAAISNKPCSTYKSCVSCLATFPGLSRPNCHWCLDQGCRSHGEACTGTYDLTGLGSCLELGCEASSCESCAGAGECFWTRHYLYKAERKRIYDPRRSNPWNCFRKSLESQTSGAVTDKAPPHKCPKKCASFTNCSACLSSEGAEGGSKSCVWSESLQSCLAWSQTRVTCISGDCATLYDTVCPANCSAMQRCAQCLGNPECGWCEKPTMMGQGICKTGGILAAYTGACSSINGSSSSTFALSSYSTWAPAVCPLENECLNGRHNCKSVEECIDLDIGYICKCKAGYARNTTTNQCLPVCKDGCLHGDCIDADVCVCIFGWTGNNCSTQCQCNGQSNCPNATHADVCLDCRSNTQGPNCNECKPGFVGDPTAGTTCTPCHSVCNGRAWTCVSSSEVALLPAHVLKDGALLNASLTSGPKSVADTICMYCQGNSEGSKCEKCLYDFFLREKVCERCMCQGHAETCHNITGLGCKCRQNTESNADCQIDCWKEQCTKCKKPFVGNPEDGRQCFRRVERSDVIVIGTEKHVVGRDSIVKPIAADKTYFFAVPPKYTNVDIRLTVDVFEGALDLFVTTESTSYTVDMNYTTGKEVMRFYKKQTSPRQKRDVADADSLGSVINVFTATQGSQTGKGVLVTSNIPIEPDRTVKANFKTLSMYAEYTGGLFMVSDVQQRVIIGIPYRSQQFAKERFYIGVVTRGTAANPLTAGVLYFRQDLPQIDLFVFFSVFFTSFFLLLSVLFVVWKIKQLNHGRQAGIAHQVALETMASRPFACYSVQCEPNESIRLYNAEQARLLEGSVDAGQPRGGKSYTIIPMAIENTEDDMAAVLTVFVQFPENDESPWNLAVGSALVKTTPQQLVTEVSSCSEHTSLKTTTRYMNTVNL